MLNTAEKDSRTKKMQNSELDQFDVSYVIFYEKKKKKNSLQQSASLLK